jgi:hypothetical protein
MQQNQAGLDLISKGPPTARDSPQPISAPQSEDARSAASKALFTAAPAKTAEG